MSVGRAIAIPQSAILTKKVTKKATNSDKMQLLQLRRFMIHPALTDRPNGVAQSENFSTPDKFTMQRSGIQVPLSKTLRPAKWPGKRHLERVYI